MGDSTRLARSLHLAAGPSYAHHLLDVSISNARASVLAGCRASCTRLNRRMDGEVRNVRSTIHTWRRPRERWPVNPYAAVDRAIRPFGAALTDLRSHHGDVDRPVISFAVCLPCNRVGQRRYPSAANIITGRVVRRAALASPRCTSPRRTSPRLSCALSHTCSPHAAFEVRSGLPLAPTDTGDPTPS